MMAAAVSPIRLIDQLPPVRGQYTQDVDLSRITWFKVGGPAEVVFKPADLHDLAAFLAHKPNQVPVTVLGVGSNLLVRDGGIPGVVIRLGRQFATIETATDDAGAPMIRAGANALDIHVARHAQAAGLSGLEFLSGIPGTIGGALRMNAGAFGGDMNGVTVTATAIDPHGEIHQLTRDNLGFAYRHCGVPRDWIFTGAQLKAMPGSAEDIATAMAAIKVERAANQPMGVATGGSTFANPDGAKAWQLIDKAGCRGLRVGGAMVSQKHCNFLINTGDATAADLETLGEQVRERVRDFSGIELRWEIRRIGVPFPTNLTEAQP